MTDAVRPTLPAWLAEQARRRPDVPALRSKRLGVWRSLRWDQVAALTQALASGLRRNGFIEGDTLLLAAPPSERALLLSLAAQWCGGVAVPFEPGLSDEALGRALAHLSPRFVFVDDDTTLDRSLAHGVRVIDGNPRGLREHPDPAVIGIRALEAADAVFSPVAQPDDTAFAFIDLRESGEIVIQQLTHASLILDGQTVVRSEALEEVEDAFAARAFAASAQARYLLAPWLIAGFSLHFPETLATRDNDRREIAPTLVAGTRETYARVAALVRERLPERGLVLRTLVDPTLLAAAKAVSASAATAATRSLTQRIRRSLAWWLVFRPLREVIGFSRTRVALVAGEPLDEATGALFAALRVDVHAWPDASEWRHVAERSPGRGWEPATAQQRADRLHPAPSPIEYGRVPS